MHQAEHITERGVICLTEWSALPNQCSPAPIKVVEALCQWQSIVLVEVLS